MDLRNRSAQFLGCNAPLSLHRDEEGLCSHQGGYSRPGFALASVGKQHTALVALFWQHGIAWFLPFLFLAALSESSFLLGWKVMERLLLVLPAHLPSCRISSRWYQLGAGLGSIGVQRITESLGLEEPSQIPNPSPPHCAHPHVPQCHIPMALGHLCVSHQLPGQLCCASMLLGVFPHPQPDHLLVQLNAITPHPIVAIWEQ